MNKRVGLGRNLSVLLQKPSPINNQPQVVSLAIGSLQPGKYQPRKDMNPDALAELAESIKQKGLLQPILVRAINPETYEIIAGERRWRASQLAGLETINSIIHQVDDETAVAIALIENLQREALNAVDQARAMLRLHEEFSLTHQEIAQLLSKSRTTVSNFLRLLNLPSEVLLFLENGDLEMGHARALLGLEMVPCQQAAEIVVAKNLSVRETEQLVSRIKGEVSPKSTPIKLELNQTIQSYLENLKQILSNKFNIKKTKSGQGSFTFHFKTEQELEQFIKHLISGTETIQKPLSQ